MLFCNKNDKKSTRKWTAIAGLLLLIVFRRVGEWVRQYKGSPKKHEIWAPINKLGQGLKKAILYFFIKTFKSKDFLSKSRKKVVLQIPSFLEIPV